ncbi:peptide/nickel transport system ATP-binding protein [Symbiobacterium terraclitae]|uniref:Peptide/nickel transport system ATP-binding protein n=1 Tax=Symbiobacterium terraclitae TaxID=557451 RepID=A0ABS4JPQ1_9FIRM|nr:peptide/nickel transport system ATP-binding protein [Symbiobacterium terraclitae]
MALLELKRVSRCFQQKRQVVRAVDQVSLAIAPREIVCLVGESGCGKTTTGKLAAGLLEPSEGKILFEGKEVAHLQGAEFARYRRAVQMVHQDPFSSLNPVRTIYQTLSAPLLYHRLAADERAARRRAIELLELVDLTPAEEILDKFPHQLSGGQRQRVAVARALTVNPQFIVADEAVSMVDVSIRASLLNMLLRLNRELGVSFLFITHDLALARYFAREGRIGVMYTGRLVELARTPNLIRQPQHPYTAALISAIPEADPRITRTKERIRLRSDDVPRLTDLPPGCHFHPRCPVWVEGKCDRMQPALAPLLPDHAVACHAPLDGRAPERTEV